MRNQIARVVLGAGFCVASAFAQAPASSTEQQQGQNAQAAAGSSVGARLPSFEDLRSARLDAGRDRFAGAARAPAARSPQDPQGTSYPYEQELDPDNPYTLSVLFRQAHGEFMDRYERYDPSVELRARVLPNQRVDDEPGSFDMLMYDVDIEFPVLITTEAYLIFGLYQYGRHYNTSSAFGSAGNPNFNAEANFGDTTLTAAGARFGIGWFLDANLLLEIETNPGVYSDLDGGLHHKDYDFPSSALFSYRAIDNFYFKFGARYNQVYEDAPWLPYLGFSWEIMDGFRIDLLAPEYVEMSIWPTAHTAFSFGAQVQGAQYHVRSTSATGKQRSDVQIQEVIAYLGLTHRFNDHFSVQARGGVVVAGDYDLTTGAQNFDRIRGALDQGVYADITFGIDW